MLVLLLNLQRKVLYLLVLGLEDVYLVNDHSLFLVLVLHDCWIGLPFLQVVQQPFSSRFVFLVGIVLLKVLVESERLGHELSIPRLSCSKFDGFRAKLQKRSFETGFLDF